ncbi:receptor-activated Ca2+-permeable cation channel [Pluteus cervinus]|uniref:Receptor-activated Ca2+-permeable cation channel n=1 Tax=Pluteus cervinus TaxID=181527 RepID=A0ACD3BBD7_9AGAR|nr:receptor-activated Ca2+-permeable cation channel [Pluteus cervinus]
MDPEDPASTLLAPSAQDLASVKVFPLIPSLKKDVMKTIDSALGWNQLTATDINFSIVRPLVNKYASLNNMAVVYACLVVRSYFLAQAEVNLAHSALMMSRGMMCEILAMKLLNRFASNYIQLVAVLTTTWNPLAGAPDGVVEDVKKAMGGDDDGMDSPQSALEMAISTKAKEFLSAPISQKVVNDIYSGRVVFTLAGTRSVLADNYKPRAIEIYDTRKAPFLNHYRLRVPRYGAILEFLNFALLLLTFVLALSNQDMTTMTPWEMAFIVMASAFALEEYTAATEHGWIIYIANVWNVFDFSFIVIFFVYLGLRTKGLSDDDLEASTMAFDILACGACILFPRLAFFAISNNVVVLSLRAMISQFVFFIGIAAVCFSGLLFTLWTLAKDAPPVDRQPWTFGSIAWLMVQIWFGNTYLSFAQASSFHPLFGPILMTGFAALSNTLLLTILISILSNTVAHIDANATQEYLFQFAITTIEGVKSDALFSYQPPFNILAFLILKPASWILSPRALHTMNVFMIKVTSFPTLLIIAIYERHLAEGQGLRETGKGAAQTLRNSLPRHIKLMPLVEALVGSSTSDLYEAIFDVEVENDLGLWDDEDLYGGDYPTLRSLRSRDNLRSETPRSRRMEASVSRPRTPRMEPPSNSGSPRLLVNSALPPTLDMLAPVSVFDGTATQGPKSPLAKLFTRMPSSDSQVIAHAEASVKRVEALFEDIRDLPVHKLKEEMKELQDRQARIENLLLMLTRGMRNETGTAPHRHDTRS